MIDMLDKGHIIKLVESGLSFRQVSRETGVHRTTVSKYYNEYQSLLKDIEETDCPREIRDIQNEIISKPNYSKREKVPRKWTKEMDEFLDLQLELEKDRTIKFGPNHKQRITNVLVHQLMLEEGFEIGLSSVQARMKEKRKKNREVFIRQTYKPGQRFEFDYGEVYMMLDGKKAKSHIAVMSSPYSDNRIAYLYPNQKQATFMDAHVRLFRELGGVPSEMVYDNMRNVVTKFIGKSEKQLNENLVKLALYYGFEINVTNCFSGNEKDHVESSVKYIQNKVFTTHYEFDSFEDAEKHLAKKLLELNTNSKIEEEKAHLKPFKADLDVATVTTAKVDKYSTVRIENNFYSVPELLVGEKVTVKNYLKDIEVFYNHKKVCQHNKKDGKSEYIIDIMHYLRTFNVKPGALKNSAALVNNPDLKTIFDKYYSTQTKLFITLLYQHKDKSKEELNKILLNNHSYVERSKVIEDNILIASNSQIDLYTNLLKGIRQHGKY